MRYTLGPGPSPTPLVSAPVLLSGRGVIGRGQEDPEGPLTWDRGGESEWEE